MTTPPAVVDAPFHVTFEVNAKGRAYYVHHCCGKRYVNVQQTLTHRQNEHGDTLLQAEDVCRDAYAVNGLSCSLPRRRVYIREVCTCAAGKPECPACVEYRRWFGGHPSVPTSQRMNGPSGKLSIEGAEERFNAAERAYSQAVREGNILDAAKEKQRMEHYTYTLKKMRLAQE